MSEIIKTRLTIAQSLLSSLEIKRQRLEGQINSLTSKATVLSRINVTPSSAPEISNLLVSIGASNFTDASMLSLTDDKRSEVINLMQESQQIDAQIIKIMESIEPDVKQLTILETIEVLKLQQK